MILIWASVVHYSVLFVLFQLLLSHGANVNACDNWNYTPLHEAANKGKLDVCVVLLQNGADIQIRNTDNKTAIDLADTVAKVTYFFN